MKNFLLYVSTCALLIASCKNKNQVSVVHTNFESEIEQQQNLILTFDKDLVPDSLLDTWEDSLTYLKFSPDLKGKYKWNTQRELMFSPLLGFEASTDYTATIQNNISSNSILKYTVADSKPFSFHTPYLKLLSASGFWTVSKKNPGSANLIVTLSFNYKVDPATVKNLSKILVNNESSSFELFSSSVDKDIKFVIEGIPKEKVAQLPLNVTIVKGLKSVESGYLTKEDMSLSAYIPSPEKLEIKTVTGEYEGTDMVIHVYTTQEVEDKKLSSLITIDPSLKIETEVTENGFLVKGNFTSSQNYSFTINKQLEGLLGGTMDADYKGQVSFGEMAPAISFVNQKGIYLSSKSSKNIALNIVSIPKVHVTIYRLYENNITQYMLNGRYMNSGYYEGDEEGDGEYINGTGYTYDTYRMQSFADVVLTQDYETKNLPKKNGISLLNLSFEDKGQFKGIYLVNAASSTDQWRRSAKLVSISDIGLITKKTDNEIYVFANSIKTAEPMSGVKISLISTNNQKVLTAITGSDGVAAIKGLNQKLSQFKLGMITASSGEDFNYLLLTDTRVNNSRFDVGGRRAVESGLMAFIYGDRDLYRPGETIHLNTVVRNEQWQVQPSLPVKIKILLPNGKEYKNLRGTLDKQGAFETSVALSSSAVTGIYVAEIFTANDVLIESKNIGVEEFMPDRIDVKLNLSKLDMNSNDSMKVSLNALNMFGPPAAGRKFELRYNLFRKSFKAPKYPAYYFDITTDKKIPFKPENIIEGKTDEHGIAENVFIADDEWNDQGQIGGKIFATVFDESGRPVNRLKTFDIYTQKIFYGIELKDNYIDPGTPVLIPMITVNKSGQPLATKAQIQVVRYDWYSSLEHSEYNGDYRWISRKKEIILLDQVVNFTTQGYDFRFIPRESGDYEVRLKNPESERYTAREFYSYGWGYTGNTSFEVNTEGQVDIRLDKEKYMPGEDAILLFTTPFNGKLLVTIEGDNLIEYRYISTEKKSASLKIPIKESYMPNVYVTATLFRPLDDGSIPLTVGHGFVPLMVEKKNTWLPLTIEAPEKSRSKTKQTITVKSLPLQNIQLTVSVVDEGILSLKNYKTPDPHGFFYQKKALAVNAFDLYPNLLPDLNFSRSSSGGDGYDLEKRVNPLTNKRVKLVALWSGILQTDGAGKASYSFEIPQFSGDLRVMVSAYKDKSFGSADKHIKVADPIVISSGLPRFLSPRDTIDMPVTLTNTTSKEAKATAQISLTGPLRITGNAVQSVSIKPNSEQRVYFRFFAEQKMDTGSVTIKVNAFNENFSDKTDITVRPSTSLLKISGNGEISGAGNINLQHNFIPSTADARLVISNNPMVQFSKALQYLVGYPYGCIEQTTSKAFPQLYFSELAKNMKYPFATDLNPATNVQAAINKIQGMQRYDGGMNYWPGDYSGVTWWGSAYATHFLIEAKKAGYDVNQNIIDKSLNYLAQNVKLHTMEEYWYDWDSQYNSWKVKFIYVKENFYSLYLMALYGKADISSMNFYKSDLSKVALDSRYMLACTYLAIGDRKSYEELLPKTFEGEHSRNAFGGSFYSYLRDMAISLNVLLETDPDNSQIPEMVRHLSIQMNKKEWINSQEAAFSFLALGKYMKRLNTDEKFTANISLNGKTISTYNGKDLKLTKNIAGQDLSVTINGKGKLFYFWEIEGLSSKGDYKEEDKYLQVRKSFYDRFGRPIDIHRVKQGDLIVVRINLINLEKSQVDNVVVTDMLPAGFEIENPRISESEDMPWIKNQSQSQYIDIRDDRINFFVNASTVAQNFYYLVRAVSTGNYRMGPVSADAMYNGEYHSYNGAGSVKVVE